MELPLIFVFLERLDPMVRMEEISGGMKKEKVSYPCFTKLVLKLVHMEIFNG